MIPKNDFSKGFSILLGEAIEQKFKKISCFSLAPKVDFRFIVISGPS
jgi:hypothetical protein